ncbi:terminase large subunit, partial [Stenotrophomonas sp. HMWF023]|uniref:terminase large subunit domain-containing protein n=1 Tax=Stenotrophomonas sp. HMWF023 TaxID=2056859 RepID=UPI001C63316C
MRDYVGIATAYAEEAVADKKGKKFGKWIRLAGKRFLADLKRAKRKRPPFLFDEWHACDPCDFIEKLPHVEGKWARTEIELHRSHVFFVVQLFGFRNVDGSRRFTSALFAVARKNAKSTLAAAILLYCQCCEEEEGAQIISAATTGSQARIIFNVAKRMTEKTPDLQEAFGLACWANAISRVETGATFKPINSKASTQDGLNPSHVGLDEIHAHKSADLLNVLTSAAGARSNPLWLYTTTEGYTNPGPWGEIRQFAKQVLRGILGESADHFLVVFFAVDDDDDEFDESAWPKANPLMDANPHLLKAIRKEAVEARQMPSKLAEFKIKRLNRPASSATGWVDLTKWQKGGGAVDLDWLAGHPCWAGLDLASNLDLTSWRLVWKVDEIY